MDLWKWAAKRQSHREKREIGEFPRKTIDENFKYMWNKYKGVDSPERDALINYVTAKHRIEERIKRGWELPAESRHGIGWEMVVEQANLFWENGYRHGDHVLVYNPFDGSLKEEVVSRYSGSIQLLSPKAAADFESVPSQAAKVEIGDRTKRTSQPDLSSHESGWILRY